MTKSITWAARLFMLVLIALAAVARPAAAQSVLRDSETELLFQDAARPLIEAAGLDPRSVKIVLIHDSEINAFVAGSQNVYIHSGLLTAADNLNQLQGVIAHELGHVAGGHSIRQSDGARQATGITLATLVLGAIAVAAGAGDAGMGLMMMGQRAAVGQYLAFNRSEETAADLAGAKYLSKAGISGRGSLDFFKKLQNQEYRLAIYAKDSYDRTHPLGSERVATLQELYQRDPAWSRPADPQLEERFQRVKAKLFGFVNPKQAVVRYPESDTSTAGRYARAYAYHLGAYPEKALSEVDALLTANPDDPFFLELKGQILLESGRPAEAIAPLRAAVRKANDQPLIASMLGHALVSTEKPEHLAEAKTLLKTAVNRDNQNPFAWYQLGIIYGREGDTGRAALATAERFSLEGNQMAAMVNARAAMAGIRPGTPDCLRAVDIALAAQHEMANAKDKGKEGPAGGKGQIVMARRPKGGDLSPSAMVCRGS